MSHIKFHYKTAIIDPVGYMSGMDLYDIGLKNGLEKNNIDCQIYSNFEKSNKVFRLKKNISGFTFLLGYLKSILSIRKQGIRTVIIHVFSFGIKDFLETFLLKLFNRKVLVIVHDVNSISSNEFFWSFKYIIKNSYFLLVHNDFSQKSLSNKISQYPYYRSKIIKIEHGNFESFIPTNTRQPKKGKINLLFFGQIKEVKGLSTLIRSFEKTTRSDIHLNNCWQTMENELYKISNPN